MPKSSDLSAVSRLILSNSVDESPQHSDTSTNSGAYTGVPPEMSMPADSHAQARTGNAAREGVLNYWMALKCFAGPDETDACTGSCTSSDRASHVVTFEYADDGTSGGAYACTKQSCTNFRMLVEPFACGRTTIIIVVRAHTIFSAMIRISA